MLTGLFIAMVSISFILGAVYGRFFGLEEGKLLGYEQGFNDGMKIGVTVRKPDEAP